MYCTVPTSMPVVVIGAAAPSQGVPLQKFHHQVIDIGLAADTEERANVGMVQR